VRAACSATVSSGVIASFPSAGDFFYGVNLGGIIPNQGGGHQPCISSGE
jgi:hypothetical protein